ncbi:tetratricopeptide repeat protein [Candidatus Paracaedibacter symbiosus]|uniref:tetratricopeptide repeat protein n=1 Tax=Candidatus Paracaedibacter symbiosus TaxID=244582 RepID=UPI00068A1A32|nr:hypothetical protein [Candidatus Paracaedibacter symbiosus]
MNDKTINYFLFKNAIKLFLEDNEKIELPLTFLKAHKYIQEWKRLNFEDEDGEFDNALGVIYHEGRGGEQNYQKARQTYEIAEAKGNPAASRNLGHMYYYGEGVELNHEVAFMYLCRAFMRGYKDSFVLNALWKILEIENNAYLQLSGPEALYQNLKTIFLKKPGEFSAEEKVWLSRKASHYHNSQASNYGRRNSNHKVHKKNANEHFKEAKTPIYIPSSKKSYSQRGGFTGDFIKTLGLYLGYRDEFLSCWADSKDKGKERISNVEEQQGIQENMIEKFKRYLFAQFKFKQINAVNFKNNLYMPYADENGFIWLFVSSDQGKSWQRNLPAESVEEDDWIAIREGFYIPINSPVQMIPLNDGRLCCVFIDSEKKVRLTYSIDGNTWTPCKEKEMLPGGNQKTTRKITHLKILSFKDKTYIFSLDKGGDSTSVLRYASLEDEVSPLDTDEQQISCLDLVNYMDRLCLAYATKEGAIKVLLLDQQDEELVQVKSFGQAARGVSQFNPITSLMFANYNNTLYLGSFDKFGTNQLFQLDEQSEQIINIKDCNLLYQSLMQEASSSEKDEQSEQTISNEDCNLPHQSLMQETSSSEEDEQSEQTISNEDCNLPHQSLMQETSSSKTLEFYHKLGGKYGLGVGFGFLALSVLGVYYQVG